MQILRVLLLIMLCTITAGTVSAAPPAAFKDVSADHWAYPAVAWAVAQGIAQGYEDGTFRPDELVTEEQFAALLVRTAGDIAGQETAVRWSDKYYDLLQAKNYPLLNVREAPLTRKSLAELIASTFSVHYSGKFAIQYLLDQGLVSGKTSSTVEGFRGQDPVTRAEALQSMKNITDKLGKLTLGDRPDQPSDTTMLNVPLLPVEKLRTIGSAEQVIVVTAQAYGQSAVQVQAFEKAGDLWFEPFAAMEGVIGEDGFTSNMSESVKQSPEGVFALTEAFGKYGNPGTKLAYRQTDAADYWVDDPQSALYNTWQTAPAKGRWRSAEPLLRKDTLYDYAVVMDYNAERIPGKGSAIFLHVGEGKPTAGCTALAKPDLLQLLKWLDPAKHPVIVQAVESGLDRL